MSILSLIKEKRPEDLGNMLISTLDGFVKEKIEEAINPISLRLFAWCTVEPHENWRSNFPIFEKKRTPIQCGRRIAKASF